MSSASLAASSSLSVEHPSAVPLSGATSGGGIDCDGPPVAGQEFIEARCEMISDAAQDIGQPHIGINVVRSEILRGFRKTR
jgi:hypothetical protein